MTQRWEMSGELKPNERSVGSANHKRSRDASKICGVEWDSNETFYGMYVCVWVCGRVCVCV